MGSIFILIKPMIKSIPHRELVRRLHILGWGGPRQSGSHPYMTKGTFKLTIPNPHRGDIDVALLKRILRIAGIDEAVWNSL